jgi:hypothetical protein
MAGRDSAKGIKNSGNSKVRRRGLVVVGGAVGAFVAAAAMATGSAAPAKADIETLLDPIIQPLITSLSDAIVGFDPAAATDLTSWTDSLLASLNSIDLALPSTADPAASAASSTSDPTSGTYDIPITVQEGTEPTVQASIEGGSDQTLLVDTGSSGLVIPATDLSLTQLVDLGIPTGINEAGYTGGVDYIYLTYDDATVDYGNGALDTTNTPIDVEILSWPTSLSSGSPLDFQQFLSDNDVTGILGIGDNTAGPTTSPLESYGGVLVDVPQNELIVDSTNPGTAIDTVSGAPIANLYETVTTNGQTVGSTVSDDVDSGGVYGTIPSSLASDVEPGSTITVYSSQGGTELYSYDVGSAGEEPTSTSGTSIDSGVEPYLNEPIYIDYANDQMSFDQLLS